MSSAMNPSMGNIRFQFATATIYAGWATLTAWSVPLTFSNSSYMAINDSTNPLTEAAPYPSAIVVSGLAGQVVTKATVVLQGFSHTFPSDVSVLLVNPQGQSALLMSESGGQVKHSVTNLVLTFDDNVTNALPFESNLVSGVFKPTNGYLVLGNTNLPYEFPPPAPPGNSNSPAALSVFRNTDPDGVWNLFVLCDAAGNDTGSLSDGWSLNLSLGIPLHLALIQTNVVVFWTASATNCQLQSLTDLSGWSNWSNVLTPAALSSGWFRVTNGISGGNNFYRLVGK